MKAELIDHMGDDLSVVNAARVSFDKESEWLYDLCDCDIDAKDNCEICICSEGQYLCDDDSRLIKYLAKHNHWSPFAHTAIQMRMGAPVPIRTQCMKHTVGMNINEESRRYIKSTPEIYVPDRFRMADDNVKQGSGGIHVHSEKWRQRYIIQTEAAISEYEEMIEDGVCPEQARFILPQGVIVNWIWTGNLASYARFYNQRTDTHAQKEVQELSRMVGDIIAPLYPVSWEALTVS